MIFNHGNYGSRLAWSSPDTCAEERSSEGSRAERKAFERTSHNAAKWTQGAARKRQAMTTCSTVLRMLRTRICLRRSFGPLRRGGSQRAGDCTEVKKALAYFGGKIWYNKGYNKIVLGVTI